MTDNYAANGDPDGAGEPIAIIGMGKLVVITLNTQQVM
jgi:hypothetical protein